MKTNEDLLLKACLIRRVEETLLQLFSEGKLAGTTHTCVGQEMAAVALGASVAENDVVFSNHRCHGHYIALTDDVEGLIAEIMGRENGVCGGYGGSQHLCAGGFFTNGVQGGMTPVSAGLALDQKRRGENGIAVVCIGDGTLGEGVLYEVMNIASRWSLPLLFWLEHNGYAQSTCSEETLAGDILFRAQAFGIAGYHGSTGQWRALCDTAAEAVQYVRESQRPAFVRVDTYRLMAHSKGDDNRDPESVARYYACDPVTVFLSGAEDDPDVRQRLQEQRVRVARAVVESENAQHGVISALPDKPWLDSPAELPVNDRQVAAINRALAEALRDDPRVILLGEDLRDSYGGAFKVTQGLSTEFPDRVLNTPISEAAIVGIGSGLALSGRRPVVELMFGDFVTLAFDQIVNHLSKFQMMYNKQVTCPAVVRTPMGGGRGYGATHSQSLEKFLVGIPGVRVLALHHRMCAYRFYRDLLRGNDRPTIVCEHKLLYSTNPCAPLPDGYVRIPGTLSNAADRLAPEHENADVTVVAFGYMGVLVERAIERLSEEEILVEVVLPISLWPLDMDPVQKSVETTGKLVVVEEGTSGFDLGAEVVARLAEAGCHADVRRVGSRPVAIPAARSLEAQVLPDQDSIFRAVMEVFDV